MAETEGRRQEVKKRKAEGRKQKAESKAWCTMKNIQRVYQIHAALCPGQKGNPRDFVPVTFFGTVSNRRKSLLKQLMGKKHRHAKKSAPIDVPMSR
jgi:hypothetical protein